MRRSQINKYDKEREEGSEKEKKKERERKKNQPWKLHTVISTISYWLFWSALFSMGGKDKDMNTKRQRLLGAILKAS